MDEEEYWSSLEFRLCREFEGISDERFQKLWCDGFIPVQYLIRDSIPKILGTVWIVRVQRQMEWRFELFLPQRVNSIEEIEWSSLLPPINQTKWLAVDWENQLIQIEPSVAIPDLEPGGK
jgi:hypothetical protein